MDLIYCGGFSFMVSDTADYTCGPRIINDDVRDEIWNILEKICSTRSRK